MSNPSQNTIDATVEGVVLEYTGEGFDATRVFDPAVVFNGTNYVMLFGGLPFGNNEQIGLATSPDGSTWAAGSDPVITNTESQSWASFREIPAAVLYVNGQYMLWFNGDNGDLSNEPGYGTGFGLATSSDGVNWTMSASNPIAFELNNPNGTTYNLITVVNFNGVFEDYYTSSSPTGTVLHTATSTDGATFTSDSVVGAPAGYSLLAATATTVNGKPTIFSLWQNGNTDYYGVSTDGKTFTIDGQINLPTDFQVNSVLINNGELQLYGTEGVGNVNWPYGNDVIEYATAPLPSDLIGGQGLPDEFVPHTDKLVDQPTSSDVVAAAMAYAGHLWYTDNCTGLVWAVAESVGAPFWDFAKQLIGTPGEQQYVPDPPPPGGYDIPRPGDPALSQIGDVEVKGDWATKTVTNWQGPGVVQIGDLVRLPAKDFMANDGVAGAQTAKGGEDGHSFVVVGGNATTGWIVIDNTPSSSPGTITIEPHTFNSLIGKPFGDDVLNRNAIAYVSRLIDAPNSFYTGATLTGTAGESITYGNGAAFLDGNLLQHESIVAGNGNDVVTGGSFNNIVLGNGSDTVNAGNSDTISLGNGTDEVFGGAQTVVDQGNGSDEVTCGADSTIKLGNGTDTINAGAGSTVSLGNGQDSVLAGPNAVVTVGNGRDTLYAAPGDVWNVGGGPDTFVFEPGFGQNTISGFGASHDTIQFDHTLFNSFTAVMADTSQVGSNVVIALNSNGSITLAGLHKDMLTAANFSFS